MILSTFQVSMDNKGALEKRRNLDNLRRKRKEDKKRTFLPYNETDSFLTDNPALFLLIIFAIQGCMIKREKRGKCLNQEVIRL